MQRRQVLLFSLIVLLFVLACMTSAPTAKPTLPLSTATIQLVATPSPAMTVADSWARSEFDAGDVAGYWVPAWFVVCADEALNVRGGPEEGAMWLYALTAGERVKVHEWAKGWAMISREGDPNWPYSPQWVNGDYLCREVQ